MKGLLLKDWYVLRRQWRVMFVFHVIYAGLAAFSKMAFLFAAMNVFVGMLIVQTVMALDERSKWESVAVTLPVTRRQFVLERYAVGLLSGGFIALLTEAVMTAANLLSPGKARFFGVSGMLVVFACGCLCMALELPVLFKFGTAKGRIWMIAVMAIIGGLTGGATALTDGANLNSETAGQLLAGFSLLSAAGILAAALAVVAVSFVISLKAYEKREF